LFKADNAEQLLPDKDYLAFGVWTVIPDVPTLANPGMVGAFTKASADAFDSQEINDLQGEATYTGPAVGHYATRARSDHAVDYGRFTATATITANFDGAGSMRPGEQQTASEEVSPAGSAADLYMARAYYETMPGVSFKDSKIHTFMDADGNVMAGWVVNLDGPDKINNMDGVATDTAQATARTMAIAAAANGTMISGTTDGTTGALAWKGVWDASLHGTNMSTVPTGIVGRFQAVAGRPTPLLTPGGDINQFLDEGFAGVVGAFAGR
jgi:hypothetical protein